jgi:hypothetical protein
VKQSTTFTKLETNSIAADVVDQGTKGAGGKSNEVMTDRPCTLIGTGKACLCTRSKCKRQVDG